MYSREGTASAALTMMFNPALAVPKTLSVTRIVKAYVPVAVGLPLIVFPVSVSPGGRVVPLIRAQGIGRASTRSH